MCRKKPEKPVVRVQARQFATGDKVVAIRVGAADAKLVFEPEP
jgi:hypothetical protein